MKLNCLIFASALALAGSQFTTTTLASHVRGRDDAVFSWSDDTIELVESTPEKDQCTSPTLYDPDCIAKLYLIDVPDKVFKDGETKQIVVKLPDKLDDKLSSVELSLQAPGFHFIPHEVQLTHARSVATVHVKPRAFNIQEKPGVVNTQIQVTAKKTFKAVDCVLPATTSVCKFDARREIRPPSTAAALGDPHINTFDGQSFDFMDAGVYNYFSSKNLRIEGFQDKCGSAIVSEKSPSCLIGAAIIFDNQVLRFVVQKSTSKIKVTRSNTGGKADWFIVAKSTGSADDYRVILKADPGTYIDFRSYVWSGEAAMNMGMQASPSFKGDVSGVFGDWNGDKKDDVVNNKALSATEKVDISNNLFTCAGGCASKKLYATVIDYQSRNETWTSTVDTLTRGYKVLTNIEEGTFTPTLRPLGKPQVLEEEESEAGTISLSTATSVCDRVINGLSVCSSGKYVDKLDFYINNVCASDTVVTGDWNVVESVKSSILEACRNDMSGRILSGTLDAAAMKTLEQDVRTMHFNELIGEASSGCEAGCSGHGKCTPFGCACDSGYSGLGCVTNIASLAASLSK